MEIFRYNSVKEVIDACYSHLESNLEEGNRWGLKFHFYKPSQTKYGPYQWLWDSGWHMITWSHRNVENSIKDLRTMLQFQQPNGFIPEMIYWGKKSLVDRLSDKFLGYSKKTYTNKITGEVHKGVLWTDISQMPMLTYSLRAIYNATGNKELLKEFVPKLIHYLEWWANERDHDNDGLISIIHPWESGLDASPIYDLALGFNKYPIKPKKFYLKFLKLLFKYRWKAKWNIPKILEKGWFNVEDIGVCSVHCDGFSVLAKLADEISETELAKKCRNYNRFFTEKIIEKSWNVGKKQFMSFYHQNGVEKISNTETIQSLFPLLLDDLPKDIQNALIEKIINPEKFGLPYPIPSCSKSDPAFNPLESSLMWRGPSWGNTTWIVMEGMLKHGYIEEARKVMNGWLEMYQKYGISEYHNPLTGEMEGQEGLGMATMIVDMLYRLKYI